MSQEQINESNILAKRLCLRPKIVLDWMRRHDLYTIMDVKNHFRGKSHGESMDAMVREIWSETV